jgi:hypothetical protein
MSKFVLVSCHNEGYAPLAEITLNENKKIYCERHAYDLYVSDDLGESLIGKPLQCGNPPIADNCVPGGWGKIYAMKDAMERHPESEWIFNIDTDAMITNMTIKLEDIIEEHAGPETHVIVPVDINGINCGVMLVRNSPIGKAFLDTVIAGMPLYRHWYMFENQLIQDLFVGAHLEEDGVHQTGTFWGRVGKVIPQRVMNSYDYRNLPKLKNRPHFNDIMGTCGQWEKGDFVIQWPSTDLDFRLKVSKIYTKLCIT